MNPLGIEPNRFIVACDASNENKIYGWAQLRPIGSSVKDPEQYDALDGSGSIEKEIDEEIWEDFESEEVAFPNGFASLPWTKEYREYSKSSEKRRKRRKYLIEQSEQQKKRGQNQSWELASVYVFPEYRKKGIGSELVNRIIQEHAMLDRRIGDIYLLTLDG